VPTGGQDDGICPDGVPGAVLKVEAVRTEDHIVADEKLGDAHRVEDRNVELCRPPDEGAL
jgi:hypothetical protein